MSRLESDIAVQIRARFFVAGTPIPKARPRVSSKLSKRGKRWSFTPKTTASWEQLVTVAFKNQCRGIFFERSIALRVYAELIMPGSGSLATVRGDIDNHCKSIFDALNKVAFDDDAQVIDLHVKKRRARRGERTGALIEIEPASEVQDQLFQTREKIA